MKNQPSHTILYDQDCPMCVAYTAGMVKSGMLSDSGRIPYQPAACQYHGVDANRARNEIAVVEHTNGRVQYGIDAMLAVIAVRIPWIKHVGQWKPVHATLKLVYRFISYNRKVIAPPAERQVEATCTPDMHHGMRWAYLALASLFTAFVLSRITPLMGSQIPQLPTWAELAICGGQVLWQGGALLLLKADKKLDYLGHMVTISLMGAMALLPLLVIGTWFTIHPAIDVTYFMVVVAGMFTEHIHRVGRLKLPSILTVSWLAYRILLLVAIMTIPQL